jgi:hypothetical protein
VGLLLKYSHDTTSAAMITNKIASNQLGGFFAKLSKLVIRKESKKKAVRSRKTIKHRNISKGDVVY